MSGQPTRVEPGTRHALAWCTSCPPWRVVAEDRAAALMAAAEHLERVHRTLDGRAEYPGVASNLREQARHAERRAKTVR